MTTGTVYFVKPVGMDGPIKIGFASDAHKRFKMLEASSPLRLETVATIEGGTDLEARFHERFLDQQSHYEWFHSSADLQAVIVEISAGTFDPTSLPEARGIAPTQRGRRSSWLPERRAWLTENSATTLIVAPDGVSPQRSVEGFRVP